MLVKLAGASLVVLVAPAAVMLLGATVLSVRSPAGGWAGSG